LALVGDGAHYKDSRIPPLSSMAQEQARAMLSRSVSMSASGPDGMLTLREGMARAPGRQMPPRACPQGREHATQPIIEMKVGTDFLVSVVEIGEECRLFPSDELIEIHQNPGHGRPGGSLGVPSFSRV